MPHDVAMGVGNQYRRIKESTLTRRLGRRPCPPRHVPVVVVVVVVVW
jgi:hypothetical protein